MTVPYVPEVVWARSKPAKHENRAIVRARVMQPSVGGSKRPIANKTVVLYRSPTKRQPRAKTFGRERTNARGIARFVVATKRAERVVVAFETPHVAKLVRVVPR